MKKNVVVLVVCLCVTLSCAEPGESDASDNVVPAELSIPDPLYDDFADPSPGRILAEGSETAGDLGGANSGRYLFPIERELGLLVDAEEIYEAEKAEAQDLADQVSACVQDQGFVDFVWVPFGVFRPQDQGVEVGSAVVARAGYGPTISLRSWLNQFGHSEQVREEVPIEERNLSNFNPYLDYVERNPDVDADDLSVQLSRCTDAVYGAIDPPQQTSVEDLVQRELVEAWAAVQQSPMAVEAWDRWARCMSGEGFDFTSRDQARAHVEAEAEDARARVQAHFVERTTPDAAELEELEAEFERIKAIEFEIVELDIACSNESRLDQVLVEERERIELEWLEGNRERIPLLLAEANQEERSRPLPTPADG